MDQIFSLELDEEFFVEYRFNKLTAAFSEGICDEHQYYHYYAENYPESNVEGNTFWYNVGEEYPLEYVSSVLYASGEASETYGDTPVTPEVEVLPGGKGKIFINCGRWSPARSILG